MISYEFKEQEFVSVSKKYVNAILKPSYIILILACVFGVLQSLYSLLVTKSYAVAIIWAAMILFFVIVIALSRKRSINLSLIHFRMNAVNGVLRYEMELTDTQLIVRNPLNGNVLHFGREFIKRIIDVKDYVFVQFTSASSLPIVKNAETQDFIRKLTPQKVIRVVKK